MHNINASMNGYLDTACISYTRNTYVFDDVRLIMSAEENNIIKV